LAIPYYRRNLYVLWFAVFLVSASWTQVIPFLPLFLAELGVEENLDFWSGLAVSAHFVTGMIMQPIWGKIGDRYGRKPMLVRAGLSLSLIYFLTSLSTQPWHVVVARLANGALTGFIPMSISLIGTNTPPPFSARYVASVQTASAIGTIVGPVLGGTLAALFGVRGSLRVSSALVFISALLAILFVQERRKPAASAPTTLAADFRTALRMPVMLVALFSSLVGQMASMSTQTVLVLKVESMVGPESSALWSGVILSLPGVAFAMSATRWVAQLERRSVYAVLAGAFVGTGVGYVLAGLTGSIWVFVLLFFAASVFASAFRPLAAAMITTGVEADFRGRAFGMQTSAATLGGFLGPLFAGFVADHFGRSAVFVAMGFILLASPLLVRRPALALGGVGAAAGRTETAGEGAAGVTGGPEAGKIAAGTTGGRLEAGRGGGGVAGGESEAVAGKE